MKYFIGLIGILAIIFVIYYYKIGGKEGIAAKKQAEEDARLAREQQFEAVARAMAMKAKEKSEAEKEQAQAAGNPSPEKPVSEMSEEEKIRNAQVALAKIASGSDSQPEQTIKAKLQCPQCKAFLDDNTALFCSRCGASLEGALEEQKKKQAMLDLQLKSLENEMARESEKSGRIVKAAKAVKVATVPYAIVGEALSMLKKDRDK